MRARNRRTAAKDRLPDEVFLRLRGSLFFGPSFLVTRNKLTFRDNLPQLLADAAPGEQPVQSGLLHMAASCCRCDCNPAWRPQNCQRRGAWKVFMQGIREEEMPLPRRFTGPLPRLSLPRVLPLAGVCKLVLGDKQLLLVYYV